MSAAGKRFYGRQAHNNDNKIKSVRGLNSYNSTCQHAIQIPFLPGKHNERASKRRRGFYLTPLVYQRIPHDAAAVYKCKERIRSTAAHATGLHEVAKNCFTNLFTRS